MQCTQEVPSAAPAPGSLTRAEQRVLAWLERADFTGTGCRHSQDTIAKATGYSRRTVIRATQHLADLGHITIGRERRPGCKWICNVYRTRTWNPHKRSGVLDVLASLREARKTQCHTEGTATATRAQASVVHPSPRCAVVARARPERIKMDESPRQLRRDAYRALDALARVGSGHLHELPLHEAWRRDLALKRYGLSGMMLGVCFRQRESPIGLWRQGLLPEHFREPLDVVWEAIGSCGLEVADIDEVSLELARRGVTGGGLIVWSLYYAAAGVTLEEAVLARDDIRWLDGLERLRGHDLERRWALERAGVC